MEGWIHVETNPQQSNKAAQDFLVLPIIRLIYFPLDTIITELANYFFSLNSFLMAACVATPPPAPALPPTFFFMPPPV